MPDEPQYGGTDATTTTAVAMEDRPPPHAVAGDEGPLQLPESLAWLGDVVGQVTAGYIYLLGGPPGSAKSKLTTQVGVEFARQGRRVGYLLTEESEARLRARVEVLLGGASAGEAGRVQSRLLVEDNLASVEHLPDWVATHILSPRGRLHGIELLMIDSLMGHGLPATSGRRWERVFDGLRLLRQSQITTVAVAHVTKANAIGGPRTLVHNVDAALMLRQLGTYRVLFAIKNRSGPADPRRPAKLQFNPATLALEPAPLADMQVISARSYAVGLGEIEVQAAVSLSLGTRRRIIGSHLPRRELEQLLDVISQVPGIDLNDLDFSVSCRMPGARGYWPTLGLPLCMALVGSALQRPIPADLVFLGEVDLMRRIRDVPPEQVDEFAGALASGALRTPSRLVCSPATGAILAVTPTPTSAASPGVRRVACRTLDECIFATWTDLR